MTKQQLRVVKATKDHIKAFVDNRPNGSCGGCGCPATPDQRIYFESWVLPRLDALIEHAENKTPINSAYE